MKRWRIVADFEIVPASGINSAGRTRGSTTVSSFALGSEPPMSRPAAPSHPETESIEVASAGESSGCTDGGVNKTRSDDKISPAKVPAEVAKPADGMIDSPPRLIQRLTDLRLAIRRIEKCFADRLDLIPERRRASARNLLQYVAIRQQDLRSLQDALVRRGLSSLGRCEANVMATLNALIDVLSRLSGFEPSPAKPAEVDFSVSRKLLDRSTEELFGSPPQIGGAHIMVTMPSESAHDPDLVGSLVSLGMTCMRINCAHDDRLAWKKMIQNLKQACSEQRRECKVLMDLGGPKLRTGPIQGGASVIKWRPKRDEFGRVTVAARIWFYHEGDSDTAGLPADAAVPVAGDWLQDVQVGEELRFKDARGRKRRVRVVERSSGGIWGEAEQTAYLTSQTELKRHPKRDASRDRGGPVGAIAPSEQYIVLYQGDRLLLADDSKIGSPAIYGDGGKLVSPAMIGCTLPSVFGDLGIGQRVLFDDGKIASRVIAIHERYVELEIIQAGSTGTKLRADKGINLPDTALHLDALTETDTRNLDFVVQNADLVGYSFVRRARDVERLQTELARLGRPDMPILLKIENRQAFESLPSLLLTVMRTPASGVMIARGDLAVELGWQRLAEVQEEILWMCEAAHMPVVWATQVLETLAKTGTPSRAEITDAAMAVRAECVMLNKGPYILHAVRALSDILHRMHDHQVKKRPMLRRLRLADDLMPPL
jgi:pyruvate kinase